MGLWSPTFKGAIHSDPLRPQFRGQSPIILKSADAVTKLKIAWFTSSIYFMDGHRGQSVKIHCSGWKIMLPQLLASASLLSLPHGNLIVRLVCLMRQNCTGKVRHRGNHSNAVKILTREVVYCSIRESMKYTVCVTKRISRVLRYDWELPKAILDISQHKMGHLGSMLGAQGMCSITSWGKRCGARGCQQLGK